MSFSTDFYSLSFDNVLLSYHFPWLREGLATENLFTMPYILYDSVLRQEPVIVVVAVSHFRLSFIVLFINKTCLFI